MDNSHDEYPSPQLLRRYLDGTTTADEDQGILRWLESSDDNPRYMSQLLANLSIHETLSDKCMDGRCERMLSRLDARIDAEASMKAPRRKLSFGSFALGIASCAAAAAIALFLIIRPEHDDRTLNEPAYMYRESNTTSFTRTLILGDNTKVYLRPGSELRYDVTERPDLRVVSLDGEAYFDVARDTLRPFVVKTRDIDVKVLGTAFCVRSSAECRDTEVILERGSVCILSPDGTPVLNMQPDQKVRYDSCTGVISMDGIKASPYIAEKYNLVTLEDASIDEILRAIRESYGVTLTSDGRKSEDRFFFNYMKTDSVEQVVSVLEFISGIKFNIQY